MIIKKLNTSLSASELFSIFKDRAHCAFLDSAMCHEELGRYSFISFDPAMTFSSKMDRVTIAEHGHPPKSVRTDDPFEELKRLIGQYVSDYDGPLPFVGGAMGYLGYDMCRHLEKLPMTTIDDMAVPDCFFGIYHGSIVIDHYHQDVFIASPNLLAGSASWVSETEASIGNAENAGKKMTAEHRSDSGYIKDEACAPVRLTLNMGKEEYVGSIGRIRDYIRSGDIYQVNMTNRFECDCRFTPDELYERLRKINPAPFAAYFDFGEGCVISSSPERFVRICNGIAQTRPIKGTRPRGATPEEDRHNKEALLASEKDRSELLMIVDLERNDLGRVCKTGTVRVTELFKLEQYASVHHLVSTIEGELDSGTHAIDCIKAMFPGGSITGAPKIRAMEIIDELEPTTRNIYTGSVGYIGFNGAADFNIAIRTIVQKGSRVYFQAGGGIVWDSEAESEYSELLCKASALIKAAGAAEILPEEGGESSC